MRCSALLLRCAGASEWRASAPERSASALQRGASARAMQCRVSALQCVAGASQCSVSVSVMAACGRGGAGGGQAGGPGWEARPPALMPSARLAGARARAGPAAEGCALFDLAAAWAAGNPSERAGCREGPANGGVGRAVPGPEGRPPCDARPRGPARAQQQLCARAGSLRRLGEGA